MQINGIHYSMVLAIVMTFTVQIIVFADETAISYQLQLEIKDTVKKSLPYLEEKGEGWMVEHKCSSCHQVPSMLWSLNTANHHGLYPEKKKLDQWASWAEDKMIDRHDNTEFNPPLDTMVQHMMGQTYNLIPNHSFHTFKIFPSYILTLQLEDGSWKAEGQLPGQKRDEQETHTIATMWTALALLTFEPDNEEVKTSVQKAITWLENSEEGKTNEWRVVSLLLSHKLNKTDQLQYHRDTLYADQNADGGWAWDANHPSDALATGQSLYALSVTQSDHENIKAFQNGIAFLLQTQKDNGEWVVASTLARMKEKTVPTSNYWGTAWAVIGLLHSLPQNNS